MGVFFVTSFPLPYVLSVSRSITKKVVLELAGICLILRVYLDHILSVTSIYDLFKYPHIVNLASKGMQSEVG